MTNEWVYDVYFVVLLILAYVKNIVVPVLASPIESHIIQIPMQLYAGCLIFVIYMHCSWKYSNITARLCFSLYISNPRVPIPPLPYASHIF